jgi:predicted outer membrane protein
MATTLRWMLGALAVVILVGSSAWGQRQGQPQGTQQRTTLRALQGGESAADHQIATWLVLSNELEVSVAQLAEKQAHSKDVKQFAEMMIQQHDNLVNQFRQFAPDAPTLRGGQGAALFSNGPRPSQTAAAERQPVEQRQTAEREQTDHRTQSAERAQGGLPINQVCHQMAERAYSSIRQELSAKQGNQFDMAFIGCQMHEHASMIDTLHVLKPYASAQLQEVIAQAIPHTEQHLQQARQIGEQLWGGGATQQDKTGKREDFQNRTDKGDK